MVQYILLALVYLPVSVALSEPKPAVQRRGLLAQRDGPLLEAIDRVSRVIYWVPLVYLICTLPAAFVIIRAVGA